MKELKEILEAIEKKHGNMASLRIYGDFSRCIFGKFEVILFEFYGVEHLKKHLGL